MKTINTFVTPEEIYVLSQKMKMAQIALSILDAKFKNQLVDTVFLFESNETLYEFVIDQIADVIELTHVSEEEDYNLLIHFVNKSQDHIKYKLGLK